MHHMGNYRDSNQQNQGCLDCIHTLGNCWSPVPGVIIVSVICTEKERNLLKNSDYQ